MKVYKTIPLSIYIIQYHHLYLQNSFVLDENSSISYRSFSAYFSLEILSFLWHCRGGWSIFSSLIWAALQRDCPHQDMKMFQLHLYLSLLSIPLYFRDTNPSSVPKQFILHLVFWLGWHFFLKKIYIQSQTTPSWLLHSCRCWRAQIIPTKVNITLH